MLIIAVMEYPEYLFFNIYTVNTKEYDHKSSEFRIYEFVVLKVQSSFVLSVLLVVRTKYTYYDVSKDKSKIFPIIYIHNTIPTPQCLVYIRVTRNEFRLKSHMRRRSTIMMDFREVHTYHLNIL